MKKRYENNKNSLDTSTDAIRGVVVGDIKTRHDEVCGWEEDILFRTDARQCIVRGIYLLRVQCL